MLIKSLLVVLGLTFLSSGSFASERFYRIIEGPNPGPERIAIDRYIYGTDVLYTGDAIAGRPTLVEGTVWHATLKEAQYFVGTHNPVIEQQTILKLIESNKWEESKLLMKYVPDAYPRTENMAELLKELGLDAKKMGSDELLVALRERLIQRYPNGFFLKPVDGFNSAGTFPTEKTAFERSYERFMAEVKPKIEETLRRTGDATETHLELKGLKYYEGRVLEAILKNPDSVIVQEKIRAAVGSTIRTETGFKTLLEEYRIHVVQGKVLKGATQTRWEDARGVSKEAFERAETFAQRMVDQLPPEMKRMCFGMDVMKTENGLYKIIELNAGGESGYLYPETDVWVTQLLAKHFRGETPLLKAFRQFDRAPSLAEKERALSRLLERPEMRELARQTAPITELLAQAKDSLLRNLGETPNSQAVLDTLSVVKKFKLEPYFTAADLERLSRPLVESGRSLRHAEKLLGLGTNEVLYSSQGIIKFLRGLNYDDAFVEQKLVQTLAREIESRAGEAITEAEIRRLVEERVLTRVELHAGATAESLIRNGAEAELRGQLFYSGSREILVETLARLLRRL